MNKHKSPEYTDAPPDIEAAMAHAVRVKDFLPPPEALVFREETELVTLRLSKRSLEKFKAFARKKGAKYQVMIKRLVDSYAQQVLH